MSCRRHSLLLGLTLLLLTAVGAVLLWPQPPGEAEGKAKLIRKGMSLNQVAAVANSQPVIPAGAPQNGPGYIEFGWVFDDESVLYVAFGPPEVGPLQVVAVRTTSPVSLLARLRRELDGLVYYLGVNRVLDGRSPF
jgi:hypothetical protein